MISLALWLTQILSATANTETDANRNQFGIRAPRPPLYKDVEHPEFEPYPVEPQELLDGAILEQFTGSSDEIFRKWIKSRRETDLRIDPSASYANAFTSFQHAVQGKEYIFPYGEWEVREPEVFRGFSGDKGLALIASNQKAAISTKLDTPIDNTGKTLVVQYEVLQQELTSCGGQYIKLLPELPIEEHEYFSSETPYRIMFGPDNCGPDSKLTFNIFYDGEEHALSIPVFPAANNFISALYTLILSPDQTYEIRVNGVTNRRGNLLDEDDFHPPMRRNAEIKDPNHLKPIDWDVPRFMFDPNQNEKPADWDEDAPYMIEDVNAVKPELWNESEPLLVEWRGNKPKYWNDEKDGEWVRPMVPNPKCKDLDEEAGEGCGPWKKPMIKNPNYKGIWERTIQENPDFKGEWQQRKIKNPDFGKELRPSDLDGTIGGIGFEMFSTNAETIFDNIYVGHSIRDAENIGNATWAPKFYIQNQVYKVAADAFKKQQAILGDKSSTWKDIYEYELEQFKIDPLKYPLIMYLEFMKDYKIMGWSVVKSYPITTLFCLVCLAVISYLTNAVFLIIFPSPKVTKEAKAPKDTKASKDSKTIKDSENKEN